MRENIILFPQYNILFPQVIFTEQVIICIWFTVSIFKRVRKDKIWIDTPLHCKSDTKCHVFCKWFLEWSNGMSPCVRTLVHGIESLIRYGVPDFKGKHTNHSTTYYFVPTRKTFCYHNTLSSSLNKLYYFAPTTYIVPSICYY